MIRIQNDLVPNTFTRSFVIVVTVVLAVGLAYFAVLGLVDPGALAPGADTEAARTFAGYMAPRNLALGGAAVALLVRGNWRALHLVLTLNAIVQVGDAVLGAVRHDLVPTISPALIAVALVAAVAMIGRSRTAEPAVVTADS